MKKSLNVLMIFLSALLFLASCSQSDISDNSLENERMTIESLAGETNFSETADVFADEDTADAAKNEITEEPADENAVDASGTNEDNIERQADLQYFKEYLIKLKDDDTFLLYYPNLVIQLFDYDNDGSSDALISEGAFNGTLYYIINNINAPQLIYSFSSFDDAELLHDTNGSQIIIKYTENYGLNTYAASETNFIYLGEKISEIKHVHFSGTSKPEEFYIESQGEKTVCTEEELQNSIIEAEQDTEPFSDLEEFKMTFADDGVAMVGLDQ